MAEPEAGEAIAIAVAMRPSPAASRAGSSSSSSSSSSSRSLPHDDLERHKGTIKQLYLEEGNTLREVRDVMEKQHGVKASSKVYKSRFKSWGWRKNLRIEDEVLPNVLHGRTQQPTREYQLVNGQVVQSERLDRYLRRQKSRLLHLKRQLDQRAVQAQLCPRPRSLAPPDSLRVVEELFYQILFQVPSYVRYRWGDALLKTDLRGALRLTQPTASTDRWSLFVWGLKCMLEARKWDEAMIFMRYAPQEVETFLRSHPTEILSCGFMVLAQSTRFCRPGENPHAVQFLRVVRSLTKYAATILFECAQTSSSTWLHLVAVLIDVFSRVEDNELTETVFRAWKIHSRTWDSIMPSRVSSQIPMSAGDALSVAKYRVLPILKPAVVDALQEMSDENDARHGTTHDTSMKSLWAFAQWMETEEDRQGHVTGYSPRTRALFEELRRRGPVDSMRVAVWRFLADDHRARGEYEEAERCMRGAIEAVGDMSGWQQQQHPLVVGYVSTLRDWLVEGYGENSTQAREVTRWYAEVKRSAMDPKNAPSNFSLSPAPTP